MKKCLVRCALNFIVMISVSVFLTGCQTMQTAFDSTKELFGIQKRDMMIAEVRGARESMVEFREQIRSAMEKFNTVLNTKEGKLEEKYKTLKSENDRTEKKLGGIQKSIDSVTRVAESMFAEWESELNQYHSENLRSGSEQRMQEAKRQNSTFISAMTLANEKAGPVMAAFSDLVLFSRHNLNSESAEALAIELEAAAEKVDSFSKEIDMAVYEADALVTMLAGSEPVANEEQVGQ